MLCIVDTGNTNFESWIPYTNIVYHGYTGHKNYVLLIPGIVILQYILDTGNKF